MPFFMNDDLLNALRNDDVEKLHDLNASQDVNDLSVLVVNGPEMLKARPPPLSVAAFYGSVNCVIWLLGNGIDVERCDLRGVCW